MTAPSERWAQLTYTCVDGVGAGGWQVKQSSALTRDERDRVLADVATYLPLASPLSRYPSEEELAALPRRLAVLPADDGSALLVHTVPAGNDAMGRPGNVFTHSLLDRSMAAALREPEAMRPIELWRSPVWLTPYGPDPVRRARFDDDRPIVAGLTVSRDAVVDFLYDGVRARHERLIELLDATSSALTDGHRVVIVADTTDDGAMWIGAVSFLSAPPASALLSFSTYERVDDLVADLPETVLSVVLRDDFDDAVGRDVIAAGPDRLVFLDMSRASAIAPAPPGEWGRLTRAVCEAGDEILDNLLLAMDAISAAHAGDAVTCPWWALAVAIATEPALTPSWPAVVPVILRETPPGLRFERELHRMVEKLVRNACGGNTAVMWDLLHGQQLRPTANPELVRILRRGYLERALADLDWLTGPTPPVPNDGDSDDVYHVVARAAEQLREARADQPQWRHTALSFVTFVERYGAGSEDGIRRVLDKLLVDAGGGPTPAGGSRAPTDGQARWQGVLR